MEEIRVSLFDMAICLSNVIDLVSPELDGHHKRVAYTAYRIAEKMGLSFEEINDLFLAGLLHDCGALSFKERMSALRFEAGEGADSFKHPEIGYRLTECFKPFENAANIIRCHHIPWDGEHFLPFRIKRPVASSILYLADRIDVLMDRHNTVPSTAGAIREIVANRSGKKFLSDAVDAFLKLSEKPSFWDDIANSSRSSFKDLGLACMDLDMEGILAITKIFERIIDFRSRFTATHSSGVSSVAVEIAKAAGLTDIECNMMRVAGYLHDLGKLAVPTEILEKDGKLTEEEYMVVKSHTYHSYRVLENINGFEVINKFASLHHERLDGKGYPFGLKGAEIPFGSRIMCVADVFTAITEDRPYRNGMNNGEAVRVLNNMVENQQLDGDVVSILMANYDRINVVRMQAQQAAAAEYSYFTEYDFVQRL